MPPHPSKPDTSAPRGATVSVVMANHNHGHFITDAVRSVLAQSYPPHQVIVVDDGSTDDSLEVLAGLPVQVIRQDQQGQAAALHAGVATATGDVVCLLDADDGWEPEKLASVARVFADRPDCQWVRHKLAVVDAALRPLGARVPDFTGSGPVPASRLSAGERLATVSTSALAFRRALAGELFPLPSLRHDADAFLVARLNARHEGHQLDRVLGWYRRHGGQQFQAGDLERLLERQIQVSGMVAADLGWPDPVSNHKHRVVLAALRGESRWGAAWRGVRALPRLLSTPRQLARQAAGLALAVCAPRLWVSRLRRKEGA